MFNLNYSLEQASVTQIEAFRSSLEDVAAALAADGWAMVPRDPDSTMYSIIHVQFVHPSGAAMFVDQDLRQPRNSGFTIAPHGWAKHGRVHFRAKHGFFPTNPESALRAVAITAALGDRIDIVGWSSTDERDVMRYGTGRTTLAVTL